MRFAQIGVVTLTLCGCSDRPAPTTPSALTPSAAEPIKWASFTVWVLEDDGSNACIQVATIEVLSDHAPNQHISQRFCPDWWSAETWVTVSGVEDVPVTLRVSAPGYVTTSTIVVPFRRMPPDAVVVRLPRTQ